MNNCYACKHTLIIIRHCEPLKEVWQSISCRYLVVIMFFLSQVACYSQTFVQSDLDRLISNHPLTKKFDKESGFFKDTAYDKYDIEKLAQENASLTKRLEKLNAIKDNSSKKILDLEENNEDELFKKTSESDKEKAILEKKITKNSVILSQDGYPDILELARIVDKISEDSVLPLHKDNQIVFNKLPKLNIIVPDIDDSDLRRFFYSQNLIILNKYLKYSYQIGLMFKNSDKAVLYNSSKSNPSKLAKVDLSKILALHPKMALFDFDRLGFYNIKECNLSEEKFNQEIRFNNELTNIKETKAILEEISKDVFETIKNVSISNNIDVVINNSQIDLNYSFEEINEKSSKLGDLLTPSELYNLFTRKKVNDSEEIQFLSTKIIRWLEKMKNPLVSMTFIEKNPNLLIYGGVSLDTLVLNELYTKYNMDKNIVEKINSDIIDNTVGK